MKQDVVFNNVLDLAAYLNETMASPTLVTLNKALYFLWGFYAGSFGNLADSPDPAANDLLSFPAMLFEPKFIKCKSGPVLEQVNAVYAKKALPKMKARALQKQMHLSKLGQKNVQGFLDNLIKQIKQVDEYSLMLHAKKDPAVKQAALDQLIDPSRIKAEYVKQVEKQLGND